MENEKFMFFKDILKDRLMEFGLLADVDIASTYHNANKDSIVNIKLALHRPIEYMNLEEIRKREYKDEWLLRTSEYSNEIELECPRCGKVHTTILSEVEDHRFCSCCGVRLGLSDEEYEDLVSSFDNKTANEQLEGLLNVGIDVPLTTVDMTGYTTISHNPVTQSYTVQQVPHISTTTTNMIDTYPIHTVTSPSYNGAVNINYSNYPYYTY